MESSSNLEAYFKGFRSNVVGHDQILHGPYGPKKMIYADWTASGRLYAPIERIMREEVAPFVANTHTETSSTGCIMTHAYQRAKNIIKAHVKADSGDVLLSSHSGMTGVVNKFQRILGLRLHERFKGQCVVPEDERPIILISHMEHHSNQTSWIETVADVEIINPDSEGLLDLQHLQALLLKYRKRQTKIASITSCSNVTGITTPYYEVAKLMHAHGGYCFVDFACSAPYVDINMHPEDTSAYLDAIYFSPHKFLGGPGSSGVLIFNSKLYRNQIPDHPGGGTVDWTNPWGGRKYLDKIEDREDGGTPAFLQTMRVALSIQLKDQMGVDKMLGREEEQLSMLWPMLDRIKNLHILADNQRKRLGVISFFIEGLDYNLGVRLLNDRYGIQVRGGCSCAGTYGHYLLNVSPEISEEITCRISAGDLSQKPGWIRMSIHPVMSNAEIDYLGTSITEIASSWEEWKDDYVRDIRTNEYAHRLGYPEEQAIVDRWYDQLNSDAHAAIF